MFLIHTRGQCGPGCDGIVQRSHEMSRTSDWRVIRRVLLTIEDSELRESLAKSCRVLFRAPKSEHGKRMGSVDTVHGQKRNVRLHVLGLLITAASVAAVPVSGQWINYPTAGVPKNADGTPNLNAPHRGSRMGNRTSPASGTPRRSISAIRRQANSAASKSGVHHLH